MKKLFLLLACSLLASQLYAQEETLLNQILPDCPIDAKATVFPVPQFEWGKRVKENIKKSTELGNKIKLVFDGDSITAGWCEAKGRGLWEKYFVKYGAYDFARSGDRTQHLLWRLSQGQCKGLRPQLIILLIGTNNMVSNEAADIVSGVEAIVGEYRKICPDAVILLQGIFPRERGPQSPLRGKIKQVNEALAKLADGQKILFLDFGDKFLTEDGRLTEEIMPDGLHLSEQGYQIWFDAIRPVIEQYVK